MYVSKALLEALVARVIDKGLRGQPRRAYRRWDELKDVGTARQVCGLVENPT